MVRLILDKFQVLVKTPVRRMGFALLLSLLVHALIVLLPHIRLPHSQVMLPPLQVRLEALPARDSAAQVDVTRDEANDAPDLSASPSLNSSGKSTLVTKAMMKLNRLERSAEKLPFPKNVYLFFKVHKGTGWGRSGEALQQLKLQGERYTLKAVKNNIGLTGLLNKEQVVQISQGEITAQGIHPRLYSEERVTAAGKQSLKSNFDWAGQKVHFAQGADATLPEDAQDALSFMYQLSQISMQQEIIPLTISNGAGMEALEIEIGRTEEIDTPMGRVSALHLRKIHAPGEAYFELWLGLEYRLLPVKLRQFNAAGEVVEEMVVSDIRAAD